MSRGKKFKKTKKVKKTKNMAITFMTKNQRKPIKIDAN
jgi:hypothetical protein